MLDGVCAAIGLRSSDHDAVATTLQRRYGASGALLTDSGTSALILALRKMVPSGGIVAYPGYACIDLTAAAIGAGVRVRLYDLDPDTLSPDLDSLRAATSRGVDAIVVAHLFGYPSDMVGVHAIAAERGIPVIEDAAQCAGGSLRGALLGSLGHVAVLSFARGKGTTGGAGGAVLVRETALAEWTQAERRKMQAPSRGGMEVVNLAAQRVLSHPLLYGLPASIPALKLGEMIFRPPRPPRAMTATSAAVLRWTLAVEDPESSNRRARARALLALMTAGRGVKPIRAVPGGESGFLRLALLDLTGTRLPRRDLGALRGYPMTLDEHSQLAPLLQIGERAGSGSRFLRDRLFTVPTHSRFAATDVAWLREWLEGSRLTPQLAAAV